MELKSYLSILCILLSLSVHVKCCDERNCMASTGTTCNNQGTCDCGVCTCNETHSGPTCEECPTCPSPCEIYQDCVSCKVFGTGPLGTLECVDTCDKIVSLFPVYDTKEFETLSVGKIMCQNVVKMRKDKYCMELFMVAGMNEGFRDVYCFTEQDCSEKYIPTNPPVPEITLDTQEDEGTAGGKNKNPEEAGAVSGSNQGQIRDGNGTTINKFSISWILITIVLSLYL